MMPQIGAARELAYGFSPGASLPSPAISSANVRRSTATVNR
jgi:hypothetical protein